MTAGDNKYRVDTARDNVANLDEVLQVIATRIGHVRIISVTWQPSRRLASDPTGATIPAGYTIISETEL